jgi:hypothetical protein
VKPLWLILMNCCALFSASAQNPAFLTFKVVDAETNRAIKTAKVKIPNTLLPEFSVTGESETINLGQYQIRPGQLLQVVEITADKYEKRTLPPFVVQSGADTLQVALLAKASSTAGSNYFVYGIVQSSDRRLQHNIPIVIYSGNKQFTASTDRFGYYFKKIKKQDITATSMRVVFSGGRTLNDATDTITIERNKYFYAADAVLQKKNTLQVINGHLLSKKKIPANVNVVLVCGEETKRTVSDAAGDFTLSFDASGFETGARLPLTVSGRGWEILDTSVVVLEEGGNRELAFYLQPSEFFSRSPHEVFLSARSFPVNTDFQAAAGYAYHLPSAEKRIALQVFSGYRYFENEFEFNTLPNLIDSSGSEPVFFTDSVTRSFESLIIGAGITAYLDPLDLNTRWNPVAGFQFTIGPKKDFWLIEPSLMAGALFNFNDRWAITLAAQLSYSRYSYQHPTFQTFSDADFETASTSSLRPFLVFTLQFFPEP